MSARQNKSKGKIKMVLLGLVGSSIFIYILKAKYPYNIKFNRNLGRALSIEYYVDKLNIDVARAIPIRP
jgi:hypothetical protein